MDNMKSFALAYKLRGKVEEKDFPQCNLHINLWNLPKAKNNNGPFIDFGIKLTNYKSVEKITFTIPFSIDSKDIDDLSHLLGVKETQLIFNDIAYKHEDSNTKYKRIIKTNEAISFLPIKPKISGDSFLEQIQFDRQKNYSSITINLKKYYNMIADKTTAVYFRFRIDSPLVEQMLIETLKEKNYYLESAFTERQIIDIKINDSRNIAFNEISRYTNDKFILATFNSIHLFLMTPASYEVTIWDSFSECRKLETNEWDTYTQNKVNTKNASVFHWVKRKNSTNNVDKFTQLIKIEYRSTNWKLLCIYCLIVLVLGALGNFLFEITKNLIHCLLEAIL